MYLVKKLMTKDVVAYIGKNKSCPGLQENAKWIDGWMVRV